MRFDMVLSDLIMSKPSRWPGFGTARTAQKTSARIPWVRAFLFAAALATGAPLRADLPAPKLPAPTQSQPPAFTLPVACTLGDNCYIQNYFDSDPGPTARDFRCNPHSYDGHKGTDFAVPTLADMARGVQVLAAAEGRVLSMRDGQEDGAYLAAPSRVRNSECGNGLVIDHGHGWQTQYCHLRKGSLLVKPGQNVARGAPLGLIGQSGAAEFPHLHFSVRHLRKPIDPFNPDGIDACALPPPRTLWQGAAPPYMPGGVLLAGFAASRPPLETIRAGTAATATLPADAAQIVLWGYLFNTRTGDRVQIEFSGPDGIHHQSTHAVPRNIASLSQAAAKRRPGAAWPPGIYTGRITHLRANRPLDHKITRIEIMR